MLCEVVDCGKALWWWFLGKISVFYWQVGSPWPHSVSRDVQSSCYLWAAPRALMRSVDSCGLPVTFPVEHLRMAHLWERLRGFLWICYTKNKPWRVQNWARRAGTQGGGDWMDWIPGRAWKGWRAGWAMDQTSPKSLPSVCHVSKHCCVSSGDKGSCASSTGWLEIFPPGLQ